MSRTPGPTSAPQSLTVRRSRIPKVSATPWPEQHATIDRREPEANLRDWAAYDPRGAMPVLTVNGSLIAILRWDLSRFAGNKAARSGLLELRTHSLQRPAGERKDFGEIRVVEIIGGDPAWKQSSVSYARLSGGRPAEEVFNPQMIVDVAVNRAPGGSTLITLSQPVLQRLLDGRTKGIALMPLGSLNAAFLTSATENSAPTLYLDVIAP